MDFDGQYLAQLNEEDLGIKVFEIFEEQLDYTEDNETETQMDQKKKTVTKRWKHRDQSLWPKILT